MEISGYDVAAVVAKVRRVLPNDLGAWPGGYPDEVEAALIDAVLSIRATYGQSHNGVRGAVGKWRAFRAAELDDLNALATCDPDQLAQVVENDQRLSGGALKAAGIVEAAQRLMAVGVRHADDLAVPSPEHKSAYRRGHGLGPVTWNYFLMLLGVPGVKADTWIVRFVEEALGRSVSAPEVEQLMLATARELGVDPKALDHNVWLYKRERGRRQAD